MWDAHNKCWLSYCPSCVLCAVKSLPLHDVLGFSGVHKLRLYLARIERTGGSQVPLVQFSRYLQFLHSLIVSRTERDAVDFVCTMSKTAKVLDENSVRRCSARSYGPRPESMGETGASDTEA